MNVGWKLQECGTALKVFCCLFLICLLVVHNSSYCAREWTQFWMSKNWPSLQEQYNLGWMVYVDFKKSFLLHLSSYLLLKGISYRWKLLPEHNYFQINLSENTLKTCDSVRDSQGLENTIWSTWLRCISMNYKGIWEQGYCCLFCLTLSSKNIWLLAPTVLEKSNRTRPKQTQNQSI